jgi:hypothetical protein
MKHKSGDGPYISAHISISASAHIMLHHTLLIKIYKLNSIAIIDEIFNEDNRA